MKLHMGYQIKTDDIRKAITNKVVIGETVAQALARLSQNKKIRNIKAKSGLDDYQASLKEAQQTKVSDNVLDIKSKDDSVPAVFVPDTIEDIKEMDGVENTFENPNIENIKAATGTTVAESADRKAMESKLEASLEALKEKDGVE